MKLKIVSALILLNLILTLVSCTADNTDLTDEPSTQSVSTDEEIFTVEQVTEEPTVDLATFQPGTADVSDKFPISGTRALSTNFDEILSQSELTHSDFLTTEYVPDRIGLYIVRKNDQLGLIDLDGKQLLPFAYSKIYYIDAEIIACYTDNIIELRDLAGTLIASLPQDVSYIAKYCDGLARVRVGGEENGKYGYIDRSGKYVMQPVYSHAYNFSRGTGIVCQPDGKYAVIDTKGTVIMTNSQHIYYYRDGVAFTFSLDETPFSMKVVSSEGELLHSYDGLITYEYGVYPEIKDDYTLLEKMVDAGDDYIFRMFVIDNMGNPIGENDYEWIVSIEPEGIVVKDGNTSGLLSYDGTYTPFEDFLVVSYSQRKGQPILMQSGDKYGYANASGSVVIPAQFDKAEGFENGLAVVEKDGMKGVINRSGKYVLPADDKYAEITAYEEGYILYSNVMDIPDEKLGIINADGKKLTEPMYYNVYKFGASAYLGLKDNDKWDILSADGVILATVDSAVFSYSKASAHTIAVENSGVWSLIYYK